jgi:hypothetical protein
MNRDKLTLKTNSIPREILSGLFSFQWAFISASSSLKFFRRNFKQNKSENKYLCRNEARKLCVLCNHKNIIIYPKNTLQYIMWITTKFFQSEKLFSNLALSSRNERSIHPYIFAYFETQCNPPRAPPKDKKGARKPYRRGNIYSSVSPPFS